MPGNCWRSAANALPVSVRIAGQDPVPWIPKVCVRAAECNTPAANATHTAEGWGLLTAPHSDPHLSVLLPACLSLPARLQGGFKRAGQRVTIDGRGSLILRPTYFELSVVHRGSEVKDHMTGSYAQSLAAILRAQVGELRWWSGRRLRAGAKCALCSMRRLEFAGGVAWLAGRLGCAGGAFPCISECL